MIVPLVIVALFLAFAWWLARYLLRHDAGEHEPHRALWMAFLLGGFGLAIAGALEIVLLPGLLERQTMGMLAGQMLAVAVIEEACKFAPLAWFIYRKRYFNEYTDGVIYFALAGIGFGLPENILYTLEFGAGAGVLRFIFTPMFHASVTAIVGYALICHKLGKTTSAGVWAAFLAAVGLHWLYDFGLFSHMLGFIIISLLVSIGLSIGLFWLIARARKRDLADRTAKLEDEKSPVSGPAEPDRALARSSASVPTPQTSGPIERID